MRSFQCRCEISDKGLNTNLITEQRRRSYLAGARPRQCDRSVCVIDDNGRARGSGKRRGIGRSEKSHVRVFRRFHFQFGAPRGLAVGRRRHTRVNAVVALLEVCKKKKKSSRFIRCLECNRYVLFIFLRVKIEIRVRREATHS